MPTTINGSGSADFHTALPVAEGGTGATASTGSGNVVLSASPTLTGTVNAAAITASGDIKTTHAGNTAVEAVSTGNSYATLKVKNSQQDYSAQIRTDQGQAFVIRDETAGVNRLLLSTAGTVTLATPLPVASGGTGVASNVGTVASVNMLQTRTQGTFVGGASGNGTVITPLNITFTPKKAGNKVVLEFSANGEGSTNLVFLVSRNDVLLTDSTDASNNRWAGVANMAHDNDDDSTTNNNFIRILDLNTLATETTYKLQIRASGGTAHTYKLNRPIGSAGADNYETTLSVATATEIWT